jgi:hypothetical protein
MDYRYLGGAVKYGGGLIIHTSLKVWLDSLSLVEAYIDYQRQAGILKMLRRRSVEVGVY